jgi:hypothetical protein
VESPVPLEPPGGRIVAPFGRGNTDESALHRRLDAIERRQYLVLGLLVVPYVVGVASFLLRGISVSAGTLVVLGVGVVFVCFLGLLYAGYRARLPSRR